ncbi:hypothetical protein, partial [Streptomyces minutiscleroticus]|uniref:hypothetical protein n=1 Tax=Streptomyces minutiscleroticus TaxID=68238 RepID=UPI00332505E3
WSGHGELVDALADRDAAAAHGESVLADRVHHPGQVAAAHPLLGVWQQVSPAAVMMACRIGRPQFVPPRCFKLSCRPSLELIPSYPAFPNQVERATGVPPDLLERRHKISLT